MGLLNAIRTYDPERGVLFRTYAHVCVGNSLKNMARRLNDQKVTAAS